jgi:hypothetical protein
MNAPVPIDLFLGSWSFARSQRRSSMTTGSRIIAGLARLCQPAKQATASADALGAQSGENR